MTLYRTHRPQHFIDVVGQTGATTTLQRALQLNRVAHAYLFSGPRGTGKTTTARIFARALVCLSPKQSPDSELGYEPCDACANCATILAGEATDLLEIDAASNRGVDDVRVLREQIQYGPLQLSRKIYIVDEVHMLTNEAFNALLKTLEEPPSYTLFILATTELHKVPATIRSRCQLIRFERGSIEAISRKLEIIASKEGFVLEPGVAELLALHADGGFRDAETILESLSTQSPITLESTRLSLGIIPGKVAFALIDAILAANSQEAMRIIREDLSAVPGSLDRVITQLVNEVRSRIHGHLQATTDASDFSFPLATYAMEQLLMAYLLQRGTPLAVAPLEIACLNICNYPGQRSLIVADTEDSKPVSIVETAVKVREISQSTSVLANTSPVQVVTATVPIVELREADSSTTTDIRRAWKQMIEYIGRDNVILSQAIKQAVFHTAENGVITMRIKYKFHAEKLGEKKNRASIQKCLKEFTGQDWEILFEVTDSITRKPDAIRLAATAQDAAEVFNS